MSSACWTDIVGWFACFHDILLSMSDTTSLWFGFIYENILVRTISCPDHIGIFCVSIWSYLSWKQGGGQTEEKFANPNVPLSQGKILQPFISEYSVWFQWLRFIFIRWSANKIMMYYKYLICKIKKPNTVCFLILLTTQDTSVFQKEGYSVIYFHDPIYDS